MPVRAYSQLWPTQLYICALNVTYAAQSDPAAVVVVMQQLQATLAPLLVMHQLCKIHNSHVRDSPPAGFIFENVNQSHDDHLSGAGGSNWKASLSFSSIVLPFVPQSSTKANFTIHRVKSIQTLQYRQTSALYKSLSLIFIHYPLANTQWHPTDYKTERLKPSTQFCSLSVYMCVFPFRRMLFQCPLI